MDAGKHESQRTTLVYTLPCGDDIWADSAQPLDLNFRELEVAEKNITSRAEAVDNHAQITR